MLLTAASAEMSDGASKNALPLLHRALELTPDDARLHRQLGNTLIRLGDQGGALQELERALALAPTNEKIRTDLIKVLRAMKEFSKLEQVVMEGTQTNPESAGLHFEAAGLAAKAGRTDEAIKYYSAAWKLRPEEISAPFELATLYFGIGRTSDGLAALEAVLKIQPRHQPTLTLLVLHGIESGDLRTRDWLQRLEAQPEPPAGLVDLRRSYQRRFGSAP
jgi:tetratricopeptide (TPR) repeat protein